MHHSNEPGCYYTMTHAGHMRTLSTPKHHTEWMTHAPRHTLAAVAKPAQVMRCIRLRTYPCACLPRLAWLGSHHHRPPHPHHHRPHPHHPPAKHSQHTKRMINSHTRSNWHSTGCYLTHMAEDMAASAGYAHSCVLLSTAPTLVPVIHAALRMPHTATTH